MKQTVLVTGATGFLGSHLVKILLKKDYDVIILKRSFSNTWRINDVLSRLTSYDIDVCNLEQPFQEAGKIDSVIHTSTNQGRNHETISEIFAANTIFPLQLLEIAASFHTKLFINTDTILNKELNSYALSKHHFKEWGKQFANQGKILFVNNKLEHIIGPGDDEFKFSTYIIKHCLNNAAELELTLGEQKRDFIYINDVVSAYLLLLKKAPQQPELYQEYELGSGQAISIREFVETVHQMTQSKTVLKFGALPYRKYEIMNFQADIEKLKTLGWSPSYSLKKGLELTISALDESR